MGQYLSYLLDFAAFALVAFGVFIIARRVEMQQSVQRRLRGDAPQGDAKKKRVLSPLVRNTEVKSPVLQWVQRTTLTDPEERTRMRRELALAGFDNPAAPAIYVIGRFVVAAGLPTIFVFSQTLSATPIRGILFVIIAAGLAASPACSRAAGRGREPHQCAQDPDRARVSGRPRPDGGVRRSRSRHGRRHRPRGR